MNGQSATAKAPLEEAFATLLMAPGSEPISIEQITDRSALAALESEWDALSDRAPHASFFSSCEWTRVWLDAFQGERPLLFLVIRRGAALVGVVPLLTGARLWPCSAHGLEAALNDHSPCGDLLCEGDPLPLLGAVLNHLRRTQGSTSIRLPRLPAASPVAVALRGYAAAWRLGVFEQPSRCSQVVRLDTDWPGYLATRSRQAQREWRRKRRRLEEAGRVERRTVTTSEAVSRGMADVLEIERHSWKQGTGTSLPTEPGVEGFYTRLAEVCAGRGWLRLSLLYLGGRPAAYVFGVVYRNELLALKTSFDERLADVSPGQGLVLQVIEDAVRDGLAAVDLLGYASRWKLEMANDERPHVDLCVFPRLSLRCAACSFMQDEVTPPVKGLRQRLATAGARLLSTLGRRP